MGKMVTEVLRFFEKIVFFIKHSLKLFKHIRMKIFKRYLIFGLIGVVFLIIMSFGTAFAYKWLSRNIQEDYNSKIGALQKQISGLQGQIALQSKQNISSALSSKEVNNRQNVIQKTGEESLTETVSKVVPAVVSIVITENVPKYRIEYQNPFGDDPFFQNIGIRIPVYRPTGETVPQKIGAGTGFLITQDGYIVTNRHVVSNEKASYTILLSDGRQQVARIVFRDQNNDIAIIKIDGNNFPIVKLGDSDKLKLGETVVAIGNALGEYNNSVSLGIVSGLNRTITASGRNGTETLNGVIQTDAAINPGNSGGPLVDLNGNAVGINVATVEGSSNISFSIPINSIKSIIKNVLGR